MMDLWNSMGGMLQAEVTSADPAGTLSAITRSGVTLYGVEQGSDDLTVRFQIHRKDGYKLRKILDKRGDAINKEKGSGLYWHALELLRRPLLVIGLLLIVLLTIYLPTRVFFLRVEGNANIPTRLILEKCQECGISFGASRREVRSERVKNALLSAVDGLQWAGINTSGCVATVTVRERSVEEADESGTGVSSIVALRDGVITECTATKGSPLCKIGQAVRAGQVLISGYTDCGTTIRAEEAEGEVFAETERNLTAFCPLDWQIKTASNGEVRKYALIIGKKRINLYKGSGILGAGCDKMYVENYVTLPGGFQLPIAIVTEVWQQRDTEQDPMGEDAARELLSSYARSYLSSQMIAGQIRKADEAVAAESGVYRLTGKYACRELIGIVRSEEILRPNGEHD